MTRRWPRANAPRRASLPDGSRLLSPVFLRAHWRSERRLPVWQVWVSVLTKSPIAQKLAADAARGHGTYAMVRFAHEANAGEITQFLENYQATLVDGPRPGGFYRRRLLIALAAKH